MSTSDLVLDKTTFLDISIDSFEKWYDENLQIIELIKKRIDTDLLGYSDESGANRLALYKVRCKEKRSFIDKVKKTRENLLKWKNSTSKEDNEKFSSFFAKLPRKFQPQDFIKDLIGARIVYFFLNDIELGINYFDIYPAYKIEEIKGYQVVPDSSPLADSYQKSTNKRLINIYPIYTPESKESGYESLHFIIKYTPYALFRPEVLREIKKLMPELFENNKQSNKSIEDICDTSLGKFPIEIQLRSILQHSWAQVEHRMKYNPKKSQTLTQCSSNDQFDEEFKCQKTLLLSAEHHQRIIYERFVRLRNTSLVEERISLGVNRVKYFTKSSETKEIINIDKSIHVEKPAIVYGMIKGLIITLEKKYEQKFLKFTHDLQFDQWGRQRVILLFIGCLLLFSGDEETKKKIFDDVIIHLPSKPPDHILCACAIYEHIRFMDTNFRRSILTPEEDTHVFTDPLVNYRSAGVYLQLNDYRRCIGLLEEVITHNFIEIYQNNKSKKHRLINHEILNLKHFNRRIGEYYFYAYISDGEINRNDLIKAIEHMEKAFNCHKCGSLIKAESDNVKIISSLFNFQFFRYILLSPPNKKDFDAYIHAKKSDWPYNEIPENDMYSHLLKLNSCLTYQAYAMIQYASNDLVGAIKTVQLAENTLKQKQQNKTSSIHSTILDRIHNYMLSQDKEAKGTVLS